MENKPILDGHYDKSLAVKCINGTFVGRKTENVIAYKGIPFVGRQPVGNLRWKAPENSDPILKSAHFEEVPIVFAHPEFTGGRPYDPTFCKNMRKMWTQFAKTDCPSKDWPLYDLKDKWVMVLDELDIHPAKEADVKIVDWDRTWFLTKYYML